MKFAVRNIKLLMSPCFVAELAVQNVQGLLQMQAVHDHVLGGGTG